MTAVQLTPTSTLTKISVGRTPFQFDLFVAPPGVRRVRSTDRRTTSDMHSHRGICATFLRLAPGPNSVGRLRPQNGDATDAVRRKGMRRGPKLLATGVACVGCAAAAWPWELASPMFRSAITSGIEHATGSTATVSGPITLEAVAASPASNERPFARADRRRRDARRARGQGRVRYSQPFQRRVAPEFRDARRADRNVEPRPHGRGLSRGTRLVRRSCIPVARQIAPSWRFAAHVVEQCGGGSRRNRRSTRRRRFRSGTKRSNFRGPPTCAERRGNSPGASSARRKSWTRKGRQPPSRSTHPCSRSWRPDCCRAARRSSSPAILRPRRPPCPISCVPSMGFRSRWARIAPRSAAISSRGRMTCRSPMFS